MLFSTDTDGWNNQTWPHIIDAKDANGPVYSFAFVNFAFGGILTQQGPSPFYHNRRKPPSFSSGDTALALDSYAVLETWRAPCRHKAEGNFLKIQLLQMVYHI